ncbi:MAG: 2'-5' RNA ligase family protein [Saprospiraceae bacterium]|nr:2'-5' RNA ligase family protein [Saprospiraceae bacterium]
MQELLFFIAVLPDAIIQQEVTRFKEYLSEHFGASHALKSPPHITLFPPFRWQENKLNELISILDKFAAAEKTFSLSLKNFNAFAPRVIYVDVERNESLQELQNKLETFLESELNLKNERGHHGFNPHMTIAHKDLKRELFPKAWQYFSQQEYARTCKIENITLLKYNKNRWDIFEAFPLGF